MRKSLRERRGSTPRSVEPSRTNQSGDITMSEKEERAPEFATEKPHAELEDYESYHSRKAEFYEECGDQAKARFHHRMALEAAKAATQYRRPKLAAVAAAKSGSDDQRRFAREPPTPTTPPSR
jgi:hypothetical protein